MNNSENIEFSTLDTLQIEATLHKIIQEKLNEKYGEKPCEEISRRIDEEWEAMKRTDTVLDIAAMYEFSGWLRENHIPYLVRGLCGSGFILYLLGITYGNPLPAHTYCTKCKKVQFEKKYKDGFDIPQSICDDDHTSLVCDGHNIPWQTLWGYGKFYPSFRIDLPGRLFEEIKIKAKKHWLNNHSYQYDAIFCWSFERDFFSIELRNIILFFNLEETNCSEISVGYEDREIIMQSMNDERIISEEYKSKYLTEKTMPQSVADVINLIGLYHTDGVWDFAVELIDCGYPLSDMIAFSDDVYYYLIKWGFFEEDAWKWSSMVRKGAKLPVITKPMKNSDDSWVIEVCTQCRCLCIKSDVVEHLLYVVRNLKTT